MAMHGVWKSTGRDYTAAEKLDEARRQIAFAKQRFPGLVLAKAMTLDHAVRRLDIMRAIARDYETQLKQQR